MKTITFVCETVTPMFLAGADGRTPELRPPSIKGAMRFWWRAMNGHLPLEELKKEEGKIFGASDEKIGRSKFNIRIKKQLSSEDIIDSLWNEIPNEEKISKKGRKYKVPTKYKGISYLLYSTHMLNSHPYIKSSTPFSVTFSSSNENILKEVIHSFALLTFFGALGARSRRGAGAFMVKKVIYEGNGDYKNLFCTNEIQSRDYLKDHIEYQLKILLGSTSNKSYSTLKDSRVYICNPKNNWKDALEAIGNPFLDFRKENKGKISDTPNFGFPIIHRRNSKTLMGAGPQSIKKDEKGNVNGFMDRRASPLVFKVIKTDENDYFPVIIWLSGHLIPPYYKIMDKKGHNTAMPDRSIVTDFLRTIPDKLEAVL